MNKRGQNWGLTIISAIMIFMMGMVVINLIKPEITNARSGLDCTNSSISDGNKLTCLGVDSTLPYFIMTIISLAGGALMARVKL